MKNEDYLRRAPFAHPHEPSPYDSKPLAAARAIAARRKGPKHYPGRLQMVGGYLYGGLVRRRWH